MAIQYIVAKRQGAWWIYIDGSRRGPFDTKALATAAAISAAKVDYATGEEAEVSVDEPDDGVPTVFSTGG